LLSIFEAPWTTTKADGIVHEDVCLHPYGWLTRL
jgi:hypothetical protein